MNRIYALYKGEQNLADGTLAEIARKTGKTYNTLKFSRIKHLMSIVRFAASEFGFDIEERVILRDKQTGKIWR